jgi:membrane protein DedA with SNARE-associated domain
MLLKLPMPDYQIDNLIAITASFVVLVTVSLFVLRAWRRAFEAKHELRRQVLEKLTPEDLARMLESRSISEIIGGEEEGGVAGAMGRGATLILIGMALGGVAAAGSLRSLGVAGLIAIAAGLGQIVTAWLVARELRRRRQ